MNSHWNLETGYDIMLQEQFSPCSMPCFWILLCSLHFWHSTGALTGFLRLPSKESRIYEVLQSNSVLSSQHPPEGTHCSYYLASHLFKRPWSLSQWTEKFLRSKTCLLLILSSLCKCVLTPARANSRYSINLYGTASSVSHIYSKFLLIKER